jgi:HAD superfamily hydrolase (TIGR01484 family)
MKVKGIILDVDGVIIGDKAGFNFPDPHIKVIKKLRQIRKKGIPIALCTAKPQFSIREVIKKIGLDNYHIADGGGVVINPVQDKVVKENLIDPKLARQAIEFFLKKNTYVEFYTVYNYVIQKNQVSEITAKHTPILLKKPKVVESLASESLKSKITKIMLVAENEKDKQRLIKLLKPFAKKLNSYWGLHPSALPLQFGVLTAPGVSKKQGAREISKQIKVPFQNMLGVGDAKGDWQFINLCKYKACMGNASQELKDLVLKEDGKFSFVGPSVDENGIISILDYFI